MTVSPPSNLDALLAACEAASLFTWDPHYLSVEQADFADLASPATIKALILRLQQAEGERDRLRMPKRDEMIDRTEEEWQDFEEGTMLLYGLKPGHVLTEADIKSLTFADDCRRNDEEAATDSYHRGREEGLRERGGDELLDLTKRHEAAQTERAVERAMKVLAEARATTAEAKVKELEAERDLMAYAVWMVGNSDSDIDKAAWWSDFQDAWDRSCEVVNDLDRAGIVTTQGRERFEEARAALQARVEG